RRSRAGASGRRSDVEVREVARRVAEAQIDLHPVRYARHQLPTRALNDPHYEAQEESALTTFSTPIARELRKVRGHPVAGDGSTACPGPVRAAELFSGAGLPFRLLMKLSRRL